MRGLNKVTLMGNVGRDPEIRYLEENVAVCTISLATTESYTNKNGERVSQTEWHNVVFWRGLAEVVEKYVKKGDPLYVEGSIRNRSYQDKEHPNITRYVTDIVASEMRLLGGRDNATQQSQAYASSAKPQNAQPAQANEPQANPFVPTPKQQTQQSAATPQEAYEDDDDLPF